MTLSNPANQQNQAPYFKIIAAGANLLSPRPRAIYVSVAGDIDIENEDATTESTIYVVAGTTIPCQFAKITALNNGAVLYGYYE